MMISVTQPPDLGCQVNPIEVAEVELLLFYALDKCTLFKPSGFTGILSTTTNEANR